MQLLLSIAEIIFGCLTDHLIHLDLFEILRTLASCKHPFLTEVHGYEAFLREVISFTTLFGGLI